MEYKFQILDISQDDVKVDYESNYKQYVVTLYGKTDTNKTIICNILGFEPYFYIKIPKSWNSLYAKTTFLNNIDKNYKSMINTSKLKKKNSIKQYKDLYGYNVDENDQIKKFSYLKLHFHNYTSFNKFIRNVKEYYKKNVNSTSKTIKQWIDCNIDECDSCLYESNIPPIIKFIHDKSIEPSGWVKVINFKEPILKNFKCEIEIEVLEKNLIPFKNDDLANFRIASFDIECNSLTGAFPVAIKDFVKPSQDVYSCYRDMNKLYDGYDINQKIFILKNIILNLFSIKTDDTINIDKIVLKSEFKLNESDLTNEIFNETFIDKLDESLLNKKNREKVIYEIQLYLEKLNYNNKSKKNKIQGDEIIQIGTVFYDFCSKEFKRVLIVMGCDQDCKESEICSDLEGIQVIRCKSEQDVLLQWIDTINLYDPDFITGYNILGFDFKYIYERALEISSKYVKNDIEIKGKKFFDMGRCKSYDSFYFKRCKYVDKNNRFGENDEKNSFNVCTMIEMDGRVIFDIQQEIKKGNNLESYKLDNVSSHFMRGTINKIKTIKIIENDDTYKRLLMLKTDNTRQLKSNDYITINTYSNVGEMLFMDGRKFLIDYIDINELYIDITDIKIKSSTLKNFDKIEWCLSKDDVPPSEIFNLHKNGGPDGRAKVGKYCIQDCELCIHLLLSLDIITNNMGMSNVCMVPLNFIFSRGQGIKVTSVVSKICSSKKTRMPLLKNYSGTDDGFEGAIVLDPKPGIYLDDPIAVLDFASLYPSCIIEYNCSQETYISSKSYIEKLKKENKLQEKCNIVEYDNYTYESENGLKTLKKVKNKNNPKTTCYFAKSERDENGIIKKESMGILPTVLDHLLSSRSRIKKELKLEKNPDKKKVKDGLQLAYKVTANSVYGQLGFVKSSIYKKEIAACTTSIGRKHIYDAKKGVFEWASKNNYEKPDIIYGDTDSVFVKFSRINKNGVLLKGTDALKHCINCGIQAGEYITKNILQYPQDLEYEKTFYPFVLITKKRYIGDMFVSTKDVDENKYKRTSMGIVMKRRDNAPIVKYVFGNVIEKLLVDKNYQKAIIWLKNTLKDIVNNNFSMKYFIISKTLNSYYKNPETIAHKVLADRIASRDPGNKPLSNERIQFMYKKIEEYEQNGFIKVKKKVENGKYKNGKTKYKTIIIDGEPRYKKKKIIPGDRIETPEYIKSNDLKLDYKYYVSNQIMKPVEQLLELHDDYEKGIFNEFIE